VNELSGMICISKDQVNETMCFDTGVPWLMPVADLAADRRRQWFCDVDYQGLKGKTPAWAMLATTRAYRNPRRDLQSTALIVPIIRGVSVV
jgi:hypothetical protein